MKEGKREERERDFSSVQRGPAGGPPATSPDLSRHLYPRYIAGNTWLIKLYRRPAVPIRRYFRARGDADKNKYEWRAISARVCRRDRRDRVVLKG